MTSFLSAPLSVRSAVAVIVSATAVVVVLAGVAMRFLDHSEYSNVWVGMWWALQTVTTVGYGDVTPRHVSGRIVGAVVLLYGIGFLTITIAAITSTFVTRAEREQGVALSRDDLDAVSARLDRIEQQLGQLTNAPR
jgi:voltage-gated potassium channel